MAALLYRERMIHRPPAVRQPIFTQSHPSQKMITTCTRSSPTIRYLHMSGIIHRDLKPSNIVVNDQCGLKCLILASPARTPRHGDADGDYVVTRYSEPRKTLNRTSRLFPGRDRIDHWTSIIRELRTPSDDFIERLGTSAAMYVRSLPMYPGRSIDQIVGDADFLSNTEQPNVNLTAAAARDLLVHMLAIDPKDRYSVEQSLNHPLRQAVVQDGRTLIFGEMMQFQNAHNIFTGTA
ncbi:unnamed protein product, partial [Mesorhabditis spiculigera]